MNARASIHLATRNAAADLPACLESIAAHAPHVPVYVWDGQSTDGTKEILLGHAGRIARWESGPNTGIYDALAKTLAWSDRGFAYILGADDRLLPDWASVEASLSDPSLVVYANVRLRGSGRLHDGPFDRAKLARTNICQQSIFYPREALARHPFALRYPLQADWELNMRCWHDPVLRFEYRDACVCDYNDVSGSSSIRYDHAFNRDYPRLLFRHFPPHLALRHGLPALAAHTLRGLRKHP